MLWSPFTSNKIFRVFPTTLIFYCHLSNINSCWLFLSQSALYNNILQYLNRVYFDVSINFSFYKVFSSTCMTEGQKLMPMKECRSKRRNVWACKRTMAGIFTVRFCFCEYRSRTSFVSKYSFFVESMHLSIQVYIFAFSPVVEISFNISKGTII